jgi:enoyl-CoA hydratase/carnithine racemase
MSRVKTTLLITINRPHRRNAIDTATAEALSSAFDHLDSDEGLRAAVLTGEGTFSAGQDLAAIQAGEPIASSQTRGVFGIIGMPPHKPVIAAVEGRAVGGGLELCMACDLVIAARTVQMGFPEVRRGLVAKAGGLVDLGKVLPRHIALEVLLTGRAYPADFFHRWGLVNEIVEPGQAVARAMSLAAEVGENAPLAVKYSKQVFLAADDWPAATRWDLQESIIGDLRETSDAKEGIAAFLERRKPVWRGC